MWSAAVICPACLSGAWPLALMKSDCLGPYHCGELYALDGWRIVLGFRSRPLSFITSLALAKLE